MKMTGKPIATLFLGMLILAVSAFFLRADAENKVTQNSTEPDKNTTTLAPSSFWIGVQVTPVPDILLSHFNVNKEKEKVGRVVVEQVVADSPAAKAGLKRGDVILQFAGKEINSLYDLVGQVAEVKETTQPIQIIRNGAKLDLSITPAPRPVESLVMQGNPMFHRPQPLLPPPGMKLGPDIWIGPRDPQKMMREMEEYFRQMQGGGDGDQLLILPNQDDNQTAFSSSGRHLSVSSVTDKDGKTKIRVKQVLKSGDSTEEKDWEVENIDDLPEEIRNEVETLLGR
ncbi:MAG: PDZ domain-containing protein [Planctomycetaceae bacterium]|jgi:membrane-associated protease RseP (regulator of RpoE activity)|nr:PDZ domain-containing protein [Planctomycetaceae bacterium]